ncbi:MAG TPA: hypothetical protein VGA16_01545 [Candidatus Limnocylindria bacterium]
MALRKIGRIIRAAGTDADLARRTAHTPQFRKAVAKDRRSALSEFTTVKHALRDRERIQAAKSKPKAKPTRGK